MNISSSLTNAYSSYYRNSVVNQDPTIKERDPIIRGKYDVDYYEKTQPLNPLPSLVLTKSDQYDPSLNPLYGKNYKIMIDEIDATKMSINETIQLMKKVDEKQKQYDRGTVSLIFGSFATPDPERTDSGYVEKFQSSIIDSMGFLTKTGIEDGLNLYAQMRNEILTNQADTDEKKEEKLTKLQGSLIYVVEHNLDSIGSMMTETTDVPSHRSTFPGMNGSAFSDNDFEKLAAKLGHSVVKNAYDLVKKGINYIDYHNYDATNAVDRGNLQKILNEPYTDKDIEFDSEQGYDEGIERMSANQIGSFLSMYKQHVWLPVKNNFHQAIQSYDLSMNAKNYFEYINKNRNYSSTIDLWG